MKKCVRCGKILDYYKNIWCDNCKLELHLFEERMRKEGLEGIYYVYAKDRKSALRQAKKDPRFTNYKVVMLGINPRVKGKKKWWVYGKRKEAVFLPSYGIIKNPEFPW